LLWEEIAERTGGLANRQKWDETVKAIADHVISGLCDIDAERRFSDFLKLRNVKLYQELLADGAGFYRIVNWLKRSGVLINHPRLLDLKANNIAVKHEFADLSLFRSFVSQEKYMSFASPLFASLALAPILKREENRRLSEVGIEQFDGVDYGALWCYDSRALENPDEVDFVIFTPNKKVILVEVRTGEAGGSSSSEKLLAEGKADYVIELTDGLGTWVPGSDVVSMPIYAIDKIAMVINELNLGAKDVGSPGDDED
jgi:hypothetical protein